MEEDAQILYLDYVPKIEPAIVFAIMFGVLFIFHLFHFVRYKHMLFWLWMLLGLAGPNTP